MTKYYTRACNFYYGNSSKKKLEKKLSIPLHGNRDISFDHVEIITRNKKRKIHIKKIKFLSKKIRLKIQLDLKLISKKKKFKKLNFSNGPVIMGIINITPDSFSDGGKYKNSNLALRRAKSLISQGCKIIDIGAESTRPGAKEIKKNIEWSRIFPALKKIKKLKHFISLDTRKSWIMEKAFTNKVNLINDVSGLNHDINSINVLRKYRIPFVINHMQGTPITMQKKPYYKNALLDIYDYFEKKIRQIRKKGINHNNIILDPGIGFGKNLKHNITLISNISLFHSLGFPVLVGLSRKRFIKDIVGKNDSKERIGGTVSACIYAMMQGVQLLRVHDVNEVNQSIKVFKSLKFK